MKSWLTVRIGEVLRRSEESTIVDPATDYNELTVRLWGKGVVRRGVAQGASIAAQRRYVARAGQFILSRIDARNGALGIVPLELDGAIVSNDFPSFDVNKIKLLPEYLGWLCRTHEFVDGCRRASEGTTNRVRLAEDRFLSLEISLPPLEEQRRIVARIEELAAKIEEAYGLHQSMQEDGQALLRSLYATVTDNARRVPMREVAPLVRRAIKTKMSAEYPELGIRSFGKGTFHKPAVSGAALGSKRIFEIRAGDVVFNNVFAWEGAVAVAKPEDHGRVGSHRFITCVPRQGVASAHFLCFHFLSGQGLEALGDASPGGAGRNRTLGLEALGSIQVLVPPFDKQVWFDDIQAKVDMLRRLQAETAAELDALLPSILDKAFKGEL